MEHSRGKYKKRDLTADELDAARNVRALWSQYQLEHPEATQESFAQERLGVTQGAFFQWMDTRAPIGVEAAINLARAFGVEPYQIRPDLTVINYAGEPENEYQAGEELELAFKQLEKHDPQAAKIARIAHAMSDQRKSDLLQIGNALHESNGETAAKG